MPVCLPFPFSYLSLRSSRPLRFNYFFALREHPLKPSGSFATKRFPGVAAFRGKGSRRPLKPRCGTAGLVRPCLGAPGRTAGQGPPCHTQICKRPRRGATKCGHTPFPCSNGFGSCGVPPIACQSVGRVCSARFDKQTVAPAAKTLSATFLSCILFLYWRIWLMRGGEMADYTGIGAGSKARDGGWGKEAVCSRRKRMALASVWSFWLWR